MRSIALVGVVVLRTAGLLAWSALAGDETSVETRLARIETRLDALEQRASSSEEVMKTLTALAEYARSSPDLMAARLSANETAAIATLRNVISAQAQLQMSAKVDEDSDGNGEYGGFLELSGGAAGRMSSPLSPAVLSGAFRVLDSNGEVSRSGYFFRIVLRAKGGAGAPESMTGFAKGALDVDACESSWSCYAWPVHFGQSGRRTFFTNEAGDVLATENEAYSGTGHGPLPGAKGGDGHVWKQVD